MKTIVYNKLVRDRIPEIIEAAGKTCVCQTLTDARYCVLLSEKLLEEVKEYLESGSIEELCDIEEVLRAILAHQGVGMDEFERLRQKKLESRGGFVKRLFLKEVRET
jgi:predicted house-cleaning noncanonical NTP pyrophosphatase (MazG superfamily)